MSTHSYDLNEEVNEMSTRESTDTLYLKSTSTLLNCSTEEYMYSTVMLVI